MFNCTCTPNWYCSNACAERRIRREREREASVKQARFERFLDTARDLGLSVLNCLGRPIDASSRQLGAYATHYRLSVVVNSASDAHDFAELARIQTKSQGGVLLIEEISSSGQVWVSLPLI